MYSVNDKVFEKETGIKGIVGDLDNGAEFPVGVWFEDDDTTIWWVKENQLERRR